MICENCGGKFDESLAACPYCGSMNYIGAEREYLEKLEDVREDMDEMRNLPKEEYKAEMVRHGRGIKLIFITTAIVILLAFAVVWIGSTVTSVGDTTDEEKMAQLLWERETYPKLDAWYDAGDYDSIADFQIECYDNDLGYSFYTWEHDEFISLYMEHRIYQRTHARWDDGEQITGYEIGQALSNVAYSYWLKERDAVQLSEQEMQLWDGYIVEEIDFLINELGFTQAELDELWKKAIEDIGDCTSICYDIGDEKEKALYD